MKHWISWLLAVLLLFAPVSPARAEEEPVRIAFIDSGISTRHIDPDHVAGGKNYVFPEADTQDRIGHGTATAGLVLGAEEQGVAGVFPGAVAVPLVVVDAYPSGVVENGGPAALCAAIRDAVDEFRCRIINISLSAREDSEELRAAVAYAESRGAVIVTCAGNDGENGPVYYPAAYETVITVGAAKDGAPAPFSQAGADVLTEGVGLRAATNKSRAAAATLSGTSYSCAIVSGLCGKLLDAYPELSPAEVRQGIYGLAADILQPGYDDFSGWGYIPADAEIPYPYLDLPQEDRSRAGILYAAERGIMNGMGGGRFMPEGTMTRAMLAAVLCRASLVPEVRGEEPFADVETGAWYAEAVYRAAGAGIMTGYGGGRFGPEDPVTREQLVTILWRCSGAPEGESGLPGPADAGSVSAWARDAFRWAAEAGMIDGGPDSLPDPKAPATRAETAQLIMDYELDHERRTGAETPE